MHLYNNNNNSVMVLLSLSGIDNLQCKVTVMAVIDNKNIIIALSLNQWTPSCAEKQFFLTMDTMDYFN